MCWIPDIVYYFCTSWILKNFWFSQKFVFICYIIRWSFPSTFLTKGNELKTKLSLRNICILFICVRFSSRKNTFRWSNKSSCNEENIIYISTVINIAKQAIKVGIFFHFIAAKENTHRRLLTLFAQGIWKEIWLLNKMSVLWEKRF